MTTEVAARVDFGGGWSDTPPHSLEQGGAVLNAAIKLHGEYPIRASARVLAEPVIRLVSRDAGIEQVITRKRDLLNYAAPGDPMAVSKAAICCAGIVPLGSGNSLTHLLRAAGGGVEIVAESRVPQGSGLGASSIIAAAVVNGVLRLTGRKPSHTELFTHVSTVEQLLTAGGGWQDQIGGVAPGIKLITTRPGIAQKPTIRRLNLDQEALDALNSQLVLMYTGQARVAKNILRNLMGRYISRDTQVVAILREIQCIAREMMAALTRGDLERFGLLMGRHWQLNKAMDPNTSNEHIETLMSAVAPYASGAKLTGAGGGGFMIVVAKSRSDRPRIEEALRQHIEPAGGYVCEFEPADPGMRVTV